MRTFEAMTNDFIEQDTLLRMLETLKRQMECVEHTPNLYAHNAQLMAIATQSLSIELALLNLLEAWRREECENPFRGIDIACWKDWFTDFNVEVFWLYDDEEETEFPFPSEFAIQSTLLMHHVSKEKAEGRDFYNLKEDGMRRDNANALDFALGHLANMAPSYAAEVAEDAVYQLGVIFAELERVLGGDVRVAVETPVRAGRKAMSCFLPSVDTERLRNAFRRFMQGISTGKGKVRMGNQEYDRKYVFVLLYYRFIRAGLVYRKLNVTCYSLFVSVALELEGNIASFRKSMNNWMQKIDLYDCTFEELTKEMVSGKRHHEQQLTPDEWEVWCMVDKELDKAIADSHAFDWFL